MPVSSSLKFIISSWLFVATLIFYIDLWPLWTDWYELLNQADTFSQQIASKEKAFHQLSTKKADLANSMPYQLISKKIVEAVLTNRGKLKTIVIKPQSENKQGLQGVRIHLNFLGNYNSFFNFLQHLNQQNIPFILDEISVKKVDSLLESSWWLRVFPLVMLSANNKIHVFSSINCCQRDPFDGVIPVDDKGNNIPLSQMQYIGYIQEDDQMEALILLSNGVIANVKVHSTLGKEQATIMKITANEIVLMNKSQKIYKLIKEVKTGV